MPQGIPFFTCVSVLIREVDQASSTFSPLAFPVVSRWVMEHSSPV